jgi:hypothetical protein
MTLEGIKGHVAVRPEGERKNGHPALYRFLDRMLNDETIASAQRPRTLQLQFVAADGSKTEKLSVKLPSSI